MPHLEQRPLSFSPPLLDTVQCLLLLLEQNLASSRVPQKLGIWLQSPPCPDSHTSTVSTSKCSKLLPTSLLLLLSLFSPAQLSAIPWTIAHQAPLSMGFPMQEYWSGLPFPSPGDLPGPELELAHPALQADSLPLRPLLFLCLKVLLPQIFTESLHPDISSSPQQGLCDDHSTPETLCLLLYSYHYLKLTGSFIPLLVYCVSPPLDSRKQSTTSGCSLPCPQCLELPLAYSNHPINICGTKTDLMGLGLVQIYMAPSSNGPFT